MIYAKKDDIISGFPDGKVAQGWEVLTDQEVQEYLEQLEKDIQIDKIKRQLDELDLKSIRAIRANDIEYIKKYEQEAQELRSRLK